jgi:hypothetical protein
MRATLAVPAAVSALVLAGAALAQSAPPPGGHDGPAQPNEPMPLAVYHGTNGTTAPGEAPQPQPVYAVIGGHLVSGIRDPGARGGLTLVDETQPDFICHADSHGWEVRLTCSGGVRANLTVQAFADDAGCGRSRSGERASLCYGFRDKYAAQRLVAPAGQRLLIEYGHLALKPDAG